LWWSVAWWLQDLGVTGSRFIPMTLLVVMRWCCGGEVLRCWRFGSDAVNVWLMSCVFSLPWYLILWPFTNLLRFAGFFLNRWGVSKSVEICRFWVSDWTLPHRCCLLVLFLPVCTNFRLKELLFRFWWAEHF
jgi:hypothetical protein